MAHNLIEKRFLFLILLSAAVHAAVFAIILNLQEESRPLPNEPFMVDLEGIPALPPPKTETPSVKRQAEDKQRVAREVAPKGDASVEKYSPGQFEGRDVVRKSDQASSDFSAKPAKEAVSPGREQSPKEQLFRKKETDQTPDDIASFYPGAEKMASLEELYRKKYGQEVAEGETKFLNTDDILFGSFLRRFETAVYGVWRYPPDAARMGVEGITPVKITFNRQGEIVGKELLQSSGSKILDNEVIRTLEKIGPVGSFPRGFEKDTFNLIAFFHYGITHGASRSLR